MNGLRDLFLKNIYIYIDRTAISLENRNRLMIQKIPPSIFEASYPGWFLNEEELLAKFKGKYELLFAFVDKDDVVNEVPSVYKGYLLKKIS